MNLSGAMRALLACVAAASMSAPKPDAAMRAAVQGPDLIESGYRANNIGVAWLEQFDFARAATHFERALSLHPDLAAARHNLALALFYDNQIGPALEHALEAAKRLPADPRPHYLLGLIARAQARPHDAAAAFTRVLRIDGGDPGARIGLGQARLQQGDAAGAVAAFRAALNEEPHNATAAYNLWLALTRAGRSGEAADALATFERLRESGAATNYGNGYLQQGRYGEAIVSTGLERDLVQPGLPPVFFAEERIESAAAAAAPPGSPALVAAFDVDGDGAFDLVEAGARERVLRNNGRGVFRAVPDLLPRAAAARDTTGVVAGDVTGDGRPDLLVLRSTGVTLYRQDAGGAFTDITGLSALSRIRGAAGAAALADLDHDGDLDVVLGGVATTAPAAKTPPAIRVFQNTGTGTFLEVSARAALGRGSIVAVAPTDVDERRDVDLLLVPRSGPPRLFKNLRDGRFADASSEARLPAPAAWTTVATGDVNKDGRTDLLLGRADAAALLLISHGRGRFRTELAPPATAGARAALLLDYDNDGLLDLLVFTARGARLLRSTGSEWIDATEALPAGAARLVLPDGGGNGRLAAADLDGDGDVDLVLQAGGALRHWRNQGGHRHPSVQVRLAGHVSNRAAAGAKVEVRAGSLRHYRETALTFPALAPSDLLFGLGARRSVDALRVLWPSGILQAELPAGATRALTITELDRKPSSCPFLFTWTGDRFEFVTDFLGGGEMGYWVAPGLRNEPDPDEFVRIPPGRLRPRQGRYELRITNELEEVLFVDALRLHVVDHPDGTDVFPEEGLTGRPRPGLRLHVVTNVRPPAAVTDDDGHDVRALVERADDRAPAFTSLRVRGYAEPHALTIVPDRGTRSDLLLLTGWTDYAFSSDNVAAHQAGLDLAAPVLQVRTAGGGWRDAVRDVAVPGGRPQTIVVDLARHGLADAAAFRLVTSMRIHWDAVRFAASLGAASARLSTAPLESARLAWRGFSEERPSATGPLRYAYDRVSRLVPWKEMTGSYTPEGDVRAHLEAADDRFVVARTGDEVALAFSAGDPPAPGVRRTWLLEAVGFSKEMDLHSASPDRVAPLPYWAMRAYPPETNDAPARRMETSRHPPEHARTVLRSIPRLETLLLAAPDRNDAASGP